MAAISSLAVANLAAISSLAVANLAAISSLAVATWQQLADELFTTIVFMLAEESMSGSGRIVCPYYEEMDAIIGIRATTCPPIVLESGGSSSNLTATHPEGIQFYIYICWVEDWRLI